MPCGPAFVDIATEWNLKLYAKHLYPCDTGRYSNRMEFKVRTSIKIWWWCLCRYSNRMEFKACFISNALISPRVDIATEWNLKTALCSVQIRSYRVDIATEWNLKFNHFRQIFIHSIVDIATEWNLKIIGKEGMRRDFRRYSNRMEFKGKRSRGAGMTQESRYSNRMEFKGHRFLHYIDLIL